MPKPIPMLDQIAYAIAKADAGDLHADAGRYRRLAEAALKPLMKPTDVVVGAAYEAVEFSNLWAINSRADFRKAVRAMILAAMRENCYL